MYQNDIVEFRISVLNTSTEILPAGRENVVVRIPENATYIIGSAKAPDTFFPAFGYDGYLLL